MPQVDRVGDRLSCPAEAFARPRLHATTKVAPTSARTPSRAAATAAWSFGSIPPLSSPFSPEMSSAESFGTTSPSTITPPTSETKTRRSAQSPTARTAAASSALTFERALRERSDHRHAPGGDQAPEARRHDGSQHAHMAEARQQSASRPRSSPIKPKAVRPIWPAQQLVLLPERLAHDRQRLGCSYAPAADEVRFDSRPTATRRRSARPRRVRRRRLAGLDVAASSNGPVRAPPRHI